MLSGNSFKDATDYTDLIKNERNMKKMKYMINQFGYI